MNVAFLLDDTAITGRTHLAMAQADALVARGHRARIVTKGAPVTWRSSRAEWIYVEDFREYDAREDIVVDGAAPLLIVDDDFYRAATPREHEPLRVLLCGPSHEEQRSGRPRRLLAPAPLQIRTCRITASGSSDYGFAALCSPDPLSTDVSLTRVSSSMSQRVSFRRFRNPALLFPQPAPAGGSSPMSLVLSKCSDARSPSRSAPFRSPSGTTDCCKS